MEMKFEKKNYKLELITEMLGTVPKDPDIYQSYIETKKPENISEEEYLTVEKIEEKGWTGFHSDDQGLFIYDYMIRGFMKNAGNVLKTALDLKAVKSKIDNFVFVFPRKIYLGKKEPDGVLCRSLRTNGPMGPRVCLAKSDTVHVGTMIEFEVSIVPNKEIKMETIDMIMGYGQLCGLGQFRNGSYGRFIVI